MSRQHNGQDGPDLTRRALLMGAGAAAIGAFLGGCGSDDADDVAAMTDEVPPGTPRHDPAAGRPPLPLNEPTVRVRVMRVRRKDRPITVGVNEQWLSIRDVEDPQRAVVLRGPLTVTREADGWSLLDSKGFRPALDGPGAIDIASIDPDDPDVAIEDRRHPGTLRFEARANEGPAAVDVVNHVALEAYLPGVIAAELFTHWHPEAFKAQAIAARSFACAEHAYFKARRHYDLTNTTRSQVYAGSVGLQRALDAVADTRGAVLAWHDRLVPGYYSSCCGGRPARGRDAIADNAINAVHPLDGRDEDEACRSAPVYDWQVALGPLEALSQRLARHGARRRLDALIALDGERLHGVEPAATNDWGRPRTFAVRSTGGATSEIAAERLRTALNAAVPHIEQGKRLKSSDFRVRVLDDSVLVDGRGFGHGVGLCQYGTQARATSGAGHRSIVEWYYPGAQIVEAY